MRENSILLQVNNVGYQVGTTKILNNISFDLHPGEFKLITGPSGCGKSTLLKIIASLLSPNSGEILFVGEDIATLNPEHYRQQVSYCAQTPALFGDTVYDNLIFPGKSVTGALILGLFWRIWPAFNYRSRCWRKISTNFPAEKNSVFP